MPGAGGGLTDEQLREIASDPSLTPADIRKLRPDEQQRFKSIYQQFKQGGEAHPEAMAPPKPGRWQQMTEAATNFGTGVGKGAAETAITLGRGAQAVTEPVGNAVSAGLMRLMGTPSEAISPPVHRDMTPAYDYTKPEGHMQKAGKISEQIGEFLIPGLSEGRALETGVTGAGLALNSKPLIFAARSIANTVNSAISGAVVSGLHGEAEPEHEAAAAAAGPVTSAVVAKMLPVLTQLVPYAVGGAVGHAVGGIGGGLAGSLGLGSVARQASKLSPEHRDLLQQFVRTYGPKAFPALVGAYAEWRKKNAGPGPIEQELSTLQGGGR